MNQSCITTMKLFTFSSIAATVLSSKAIGCTNADIVRADHRDYSSAGVSRRTSSGRFSATASATTTRRFNTFGSYSVDETVYTPAPISESEHSAAEYSFDKGARELALLTSVALAAVL